MVIKYEPKYMYKTTYICIVYDKKHNIGSEFFFLVFKILKISIEYRKYHNTRYNV